MAVSETKLLIITGMSGAGKTVAVQSLEDLGYYCVDNLPPTLIPKFLELMKDSTNNIRKVALVIDLRSREFFEQLYEALDGIGTEKWLEEQILFLDAKDEVLVSRYKETRRSHPLNAEGLPLNGIKLERKMLDEMRGRAQEIIDTSSMAPKELREKFMNYMLVIKKSYLLFTSFPLGLNMGSRLMQILYLMFVFCLIHITLSKCAH